jgi:Protein of unknown function (DUF2892)
MLALAWSLRGAARFAENPSRLPRLDPNGRSADVINASTVDRAVRVAVGLAILSLTMIGPRSLYGLFGGVPLVTGLLGYCPVYEVAGIRTCQPPGEGGRP